MKFAPATKERVNLRLALFGPSGSGKTFTSLSLAQGLGGRIAVIDTERGSASKYADRFTFDALDLPKFDIDTYCKAIGLANKNGYDVLIIDSLTHGWHELVDEVERLARSKYRGNTWSAWSEGTPKQRQLVDDLLSFDGHLIATMRTKTEWAIGKSGSGKTTITRVGLAPQQGKGIEYEFDLLMEISPEHAVNVIKDRTGKFQDRTFDCPGAELGEELAKWLSEGASIQAGEVISNGPDWEKTPNQDTGPEPEPKPKAKPGFIEEVAAEFESQPKKAKPTPANVRPLSAEAIRSAIRTKAKWHADGLRPQAKLVSKGQGGIVTRLLNKALPYPDGEMQDKLRHEIYNYLVGVDSSTRLFGPEASAMIDWLKVPVEDDWNINGYAEAEVANIVAIIGNNGDQMELPY